MIFSCAILYVLGGAWGSKDKSHVKIDFLYEKLSTRGKAIIDSITFIFFLSYMTMMAWATSKYALDSVKYLETSGSAWNPPIYPIKIALAIGVILILSQGIVDFIKNLTVIIKGSSDEH